MKWFNESLDEDIFDLGARVSIKVGKTLYSGSSEYQKLEIVETPKFGKMMILDDCVMLTEAHEYAYHEMIAHIPLFSHPKPQEVLIIGGGDGGSAREVLRHDSVDRCVLVEIDNLVIEKSKEFFPSLAPVFENDRLELRVEDGVKYIENHQDSFDIILIDSTDPVGPAEGLFSEDFYKKVFRALKPNGIVVAQAESPYYFQKTQRELFEVLDRIYPYTSLYLSSIPFYPSGTWSFAMATKQSLAREKARWTDMKRMAPQLEYFNEDVFQAAFALPNFVKRNLGK